MNFSDNYIKDFNNFNDKKVLTLETELRHLSIKDRIELSNILDINNNWKTLASIIPKPDGNEGLLISNSNIHVLEDLQLKSGKSPTQAVIDFWGTSGRTRPTLEDLIKLLNKCHLYRASLFITNDLLNIKSIDHNLCDDSCGQSLNHNSINCYNDCQKFSENNSFTAQWNNLSTKLMNCSFDPKNGQTFDGLSPSAPNESLISFSNSIDKRDNQLSKTEDFVNYSYEEIRIATSDFSDDMVSNGGHKLGEGAFGSVYLCRLGSNSESYAVKKLKNDFQKQFVSEIQVMKKFKHQNLLSLRGISSDGPSLCIIYEYMSNGSLQDFLSDPDKCLSWQKRVSIATETARGICHLHTFDTKPYVHRDIKSANILLDNNMTARVGDFGLVRIGSSGDMTATRPLATTVIGTSVYMAPEAFRGDISVKLDTFSFGVVLLELLTGLSPYDENRDESDILSYIEEMTIDLEEDNSLVINKIIDKSAGDWDQNISLKLFEISKKSTEQRKKSRPTMIEVLQLLEQN